jgi:putative ABC transport system permease protein
MLLRKAIVPWLRELALALRRLRRSPGFAFLAIVPMGVALGVNSGMVAFVDALFFRPPLHLHQPERVVRLSFTHHNPMFGPNVADRTDYPTMIDVEGSQGFQTVAGFFGSRVTIGGGRDAIHAEALIVSARFFDVIMTQAVHGSVGGFGRDSSGLVPSVLLSHGFWVRQFGADSTAVGKRIQVDNTSYVVAGVMPPGLMSFQTKPVDLWMPLSSAVARRLPSAWKTNRGSYWLSVIARTSDDGPHAGILKVSAFLLGIRNAQSNSRGAVGVVMSSIVLGRGLDRSREVQLAIWVAMVTTLTLAAACTSLAGLLLARQFHSRHENGVRTVLGCSESGLRRQQFADLVAIALPATLIGAATGHATRGMIPLLIATDIPLVRAAADWRSISILVVSAGLVLMAIGILCMLQLQPDRMLAALRAPASIGTAAGGRWLRRTLVATQAGVCLLLVLLATLFSHSLKRIAALDLGVDLKRTVQIGLDVPESRPDVEVRLIYEQVLERLRFHPGVELVALSQYEPFLSGRAVAPYTVERLPEELYYPGVEAPYVTVVGRDFFGSVGASTLHGRDFRAEDRAGSPPVAIVNAPLARFLWPSKTAIGECLFLESPRECIRVVGIADGVWKHQALKRSKLVLFLPLSQQPSTLPGAILVRTKDVGPAIVRDVRSIVQSIATDLPAADISRAYDLVDWEFRPWRLGARVFSALGAIALLLSAFGLYSTVTFTTSLRLREVGVRMALGASRLQIARGLLSEALYAVSFGIAVGSTIAFSFGSLLETAMFETSPHDPALVALVLAILIATTFAGIARPLFRALTSNPTTLLRHD